MPQGATIVVRGVGGSDTRDKLRRHAERTTRAWSLDEGGAGALVVFLSQFVAAVSRQARAAGTSSR